LRSDRKFDVDLVTSPGAGGGFPLLESTRGEDEDGDKPMELDTLKQEHPDLVEALRAEFEAEKPAPQAEPEPKPEPVSDVAPPVDIAAVVDAKVSEALTGLRKQIMSEKLLETALTDVDLAPKTKDRLRADFASKTFEGEAQFKETFDAAVEELREIENTHAPQRVKDLGSNEPAEGGGEAKTAAEALREAGLHFDGDEKAGD
ncbi:MAG TPA: hypothetical protein VM223_23790, partial [Planctomycetota bacterium]|nr:hypothetical protein [Planctomycetota bacterium]